jgi:Domain of unknown function (DUF4111)
MPSDVIDFALQMDLALRAALANRVVGTYLHGSGALGGFVRGLSDVDLLFVIEDIRQPIADADEIGWRLAGAADPCPGRGIEASVVTRAQARPSDGTWSFVVHVSTEGADRNVIVGDRHGGDPDLLMHFAVVCAAGVAVSGPPPAEVFLAPTRRSVLGYLVDELDDALDGPFAYAVLNACRAWRYLEQGDLVSKVAGGDWLLHGEHRHVVQRALDQRAGLLPASKLDTMATQFVTGVRDRIAADLAQPS